MAWRSRVVVVGDTPTLLSLDQTDSRPGQSFAIHVPPGGLTIKTGGPGVTWAAGWPVYAGEKEGSVLEPTGGVAYSTSEVGYAISAPGTTQAVNIKETGV